MSARPDRRQGGRGFAVALSSNNPECTILNSRHLTSRQCRWLEHTPVLPSRTGGHGEFPRQESDGLRRDGERQALSLAQAGLMALEQARHDRPVARAAEIDVAFGAAKCDPLDGRGEAVPVRGNRTSERQGLWPDRERYGRALGQAWARVRHPGDTERIGVASLSS